jgi:hypothetical protein
MVPMSSAANLPQVEAGLPPLGSTSYRNRNLIVLLKRLPVISTSPDWTFVTFQYLLR